MGENILNNKFYDILSLGKWKKEPLDINSKSFDANLMLSYDKTLEPLKDYDDKNKDLKKIYDMRRGAECHRQVRRYIQEKIRPGMSLLDISNSVEHKIIEIFGQNNLNAGIGFPTGLSINHIAAHDSANPNDKRILGFDDVCKVDFGTHCNGRIIDCAFTVAFNPKFEPLVNATKDGTWTGIRLAGPDVRIKEISEGIQEAIESYEIELNGKIYPIKAVANLGGHSIDPYHIHSGKLVLCSPDGMDENMKMDVNECFAIETFATTGNSSFLMTDTNMECNHFMKKLNVPRVDLKLNATKKTLTHINRNRGTLPFCSRWLYNDKNIGSHYKIGLNELVNKGIVEQYPPIRDKPGNYTSQWEHTIYLHEYGKEVLSFGDDF